MKTKIQTFRRLYNNFTAVVFISAVLLAFSCSKSPKQDLHLIKVKGNGSVYNYSKSIFGYMIQLDSIHPGTIMANEGDLLFLGDDDNAYFLKNLKENTEISFRVEKPFGYVNGKINAITIDKDFDLLPWFQKIKNSDIESLQFLNVKSEIPGSYIPYLQKIGKTRPGIGILFDEDHVNKELFKIFKPVFLLNTTITPEDLDVYPNLKEVQLLGLSEDDSTVTSPLPHLPNLKQLIVPEIDDYKISKDYLVNNKQIEELTILGAQDVSFMEPLQNLRELRFVNGKKEEYISDLKFLEKYKKLQVLCIKGEDYTNTNTINELPDLRWLSLLTNPSQKDLNSIIDNHKELEVFEILADSAINLQSVSGLKKLMGLVIVNNQKVDSFLYSMKNLKYLSISKNVFDNDSANVVSLQKALPECTIVPNEGFCMGSAWLLLIIPLTFVFGLYHRRKNLQKNV